MEQTNSKRSDRFWVDLPLEPQMGASQTDPLGSWTGVPSDDPYEVPTQDADDL